LLVSMGVLIVAIFALASVFDMSSETTGRTVAHAEVLEASAAVQQRVTDQLSKIEPGLLIIDSPAPTSARSEISGSQQIFRLRHDRLVFVAMGASNGFQSFTDPIRGTPADPTKEPASSREALIYLGPGIPLSDTLPLQERPFDDSTTIRLTAAEWVFAHRAILLLTDNPNHAGWSPPDMTGLVGGGGLMNGGTLAAALPDIRSGKMDAIVSSAAYRANGQAIIDAMNAKTAADLVSPTATFAGLWDPNLTPTSASLNSADGDYYTHSGFMLQPRLADFRIEWTDGRDNAGAPDYGVRWFGLRPDWVAPLPTDGSGNVQADLIQYRAMCRFNYTSSSPVTQQDQNERDAFQTKIEWATVSNGNPDAQAAYRAVWRADTWQYRPKALRFTYRIYDAQSRLKQMTSIDLNDDGKPDTDPSGKAYSVARYGQEFSIVVPIP
jgi:hypothetical protein